MALAAWGALVAAAVLRGRDLRVERPEARVRAGPFFGDWEAQVASTTGLVVAVLVAGATVAFGDRIAARVPWRALVAVVTLGAVGWLLALNAVDGPDALAHPLRSEREYVAGIPDVEAAGGGRSYLRTFTEEIDAYPTHVRGHPPGLVVGLWAVDRAGLDAVTVGVGLVLSGWAVAVGSALVGLRATAGEEVARRAAPFLVLVPGAIWAGTSFDALFAGVVGGGVAAIVVATARRDRAAPALAVAGGAGVGVAMLLSYSVVPILAVPVAVAVARRRFGPLVLGGAVAASVLLVAGALGFWWSAGLAATRDQYHLGVAAERPFSYFVFANLAAVAVATGPALAAGLGTVGRRLAGPAVLAAGALVAVVASDLSGLSKAEVERIWLPFVPWLLVATAFLPGDPRWRRALLGAQAVTALVVQVLLRSPW